MSKVKQTVSNQILAVLNLWSLSCELSAVFILKNLLLYFNSYNSSWFYGFLQKKRFKETLNLSIFWFISFRYLIKNYTWAL